MIQIFHGTSAESHDAYQAWRQSHPDGFNLTEKAVGKFMAHWTQDKRENLLGRGCHHQGGSGNRFQEDKGGCYTTARRVCSDSFRELAAWAAEHGFELRACSHCDSKKFPFPR